MISSLLILVFFQDLCNVCPLGACRLRHVHALSDGDQEEAEIAGR